MAEKKKDPLIFPITNPSTDTLQGYMISWIGVSEEEDESKRSTIVNDGRELDLVLTGYYRAL